VSGRDLIYLVILMLMMIGFLCWLYNRLVFASFSPSLARSRNFPVRLGNYLFIILLALIVNVCLKIVGVLLINALLVIPGATAAILARNLRQFFWYSVVVSLVAGLGGLLVSSLWVPHVWVPGMARAEPVPLTTGGLIVVFGVGLFFLAMAVGRWVRGSKPVVRTSF
jgi:zinc transport system permease protein